MPIPTNIFKVLKGMVVNGEMDQCLKAFIAFIEDLGLLPRTHLTAHNCL